MDASKVKKSYKSFKEHLHKIDVKREKWIIKYSNESVIYDYWDSISLAEKKRIVSCKSWNNYPTEKWTIRGPLVKPYGRILREMVRFYSLSSSKDKDIFIKHAEGIFALFMFEYATSKDKLRMANRLVKSKDKRLKTRAISALPASKLWWALSDSDYSVVAKAVSKIGFENCYREFLPEPKAVRQNKPGIGWYSRMALRFAEYEEVKEHICNITEETPDYIASELLSKVKSKDIFYHIDKNNCGPQTARIIEMIMGARG